MTNESDQRERREVLKDAYLSRAAADADFASQGRFKREIETRVTPVPNYPKQSEGSPFTNDLTGEEVMSFIEKEGANPGYWECDHCGQCALLEWDFMSEWARLKAEGWRATRVEGHWMHRCDQCSAQAREREKGILDRPFRSLG
jgi:phage terminase large subunit GpA-like protein